MHHKSRPPAPPKLLFSSVLTHAQGVRLLIIAPAARAADILRAAQDRFECAHIGSGGHGAAGSASEKDEVCFFLTHAARGAAGVRDLLHASLGAAKIAAGAEASQLSLALRWLQTETSFRYAFFLEAGCEHWTVGAGYRR